MHLFILTIGCLWALTQAAYVYEKPRDQFVVNKNTLNENYEQMFNNIRAVAGESTGSSFAKNETFKRSQCSNKCCKFVLCYKYKKKKKQ